MSQLFDIEFEIVKKKQVETLIFWASWWLWRGIMI